MLRHRCVVDRFYRVRDIGFGEDGVVSVSPYEVRLSIHDFPSNAKIAP